MRLPKPIYESLPGIYLTLCCTLISSTIFIDPETASGFWSTAMLLLAALLFGACAWLVTEMRNLARFRL